MHNIAGSWYPSDNDDLDDMLSSFLTAAEQDDSTTNGALSINIPSSSLFGINSKSIPNACIAPHAGYRYSGPTAAYSYLALKEALVKNSALQTIVVVRYMTVLLCSNYNTSYLYDQ